MKKKKKQAINSQELRDISKKIKWIKRRYRINAFLTCIFNYLCYLTMNIGIKVCSLFSSWWVMGLCGIGWTVIAFGFVFLGFFCYDNYKSYKESHENYNGWYEETLYDVENSEDFQAYIDYADRLLDRIKYQ